MESRPLLPVLIAAALLLLVLNLALIAWSHRLPYLKKLEAIRTSQDPNLVLVGNSLLDHRLDQETFQQTAAKAGAQWIVVNSALGAALAPEQRLLFQYSKTTHPTISTLVVGFYDFQLTEEDHSHVSDLTGNRMVGIDHRFPISETAEAYRFGPRDRAELELVRSVPMAAYRANAWKLVELLRRSMSSMGMPHVATNSMGRVEDFAALEADSTRRFDEEASAFLAQPPHFNSSFEAIFAQAQQTKMHVVLVLMPMSPYHLDRFYSRPLWSKYVAALEQLASQRGFKVIDASRWMPAPGDFADHLHLSEQTIPDFSIRLAQALVSTLPKQPAMAAPLPLSRHAQQARYSSPPHGL